MERNYFKVKGPVKNDIDFAKLAATLHFDSVRLERHSRIVSELGTGKYLTAFRVDRQHRNGDEIHTLFDNGVIVVQNLNSRMLITELIARPAQIRRYWEGGEEPDYVEPLCRLALENERRGRNNW